MPDYFFHYVMAKAVFEKCPKEIKAKIKNKTAYMLGAQGGDVFFAYNLTAGENNVGKILHRQNPAMLFENLKRGDFSYAAGFAAHYAADSLFHPAVYAFERSNKTPFAHRKFEEDLGLYLSKKFATARNILPKDKILRESFVVYDSVKKAVPRITLTGVERCLKRHFVYTRHLLKSKSTAYRFDYDYPSLSPLIDEAEKLSLACIAELADSEPLSSIFDGDFLAGKE